MAALFALGCGGVSPNADPNEGAHYRTGEFAPSEVACVFRLQSSKHSGCACDSESASQFQMETISCACNGSATKHARSLCCGALFQYLSIASNQCWVEKSD